MAGVSSPNPDSPLNFIPGAFSPVTGRRNYRSILDDVDDRKEQLPTSPLSSRPLAAEDDPDDGLRSELAELDKLREQVNRNLVLRPLRGKSPMPPSQQPSFESMSSNSTGVSSFWDYSNSGDARRASPHSPQSPFDIVSHYTDSDSSPKAPRTASPIQLDSPVEMDPETEGRFPRPMQVSTLFALLHGSSRPLILDLRSAASFSSSHIRGSINLAIPSLILKRWCKNTPSSTLTSVHTLKSFVTTEHGKLIWDSFVNNEPTQGILTSANNSVRHWPHSGWNGDVVVYDDEMDLNDPLAPNALPSGNLLGSPAWTLLSVLVPLFTTTPPLAAAAATSSPRLFYLSGGFSSIDAFVAQDPINRRFLTDTQAEVHEINSLHEGERGSADGDSPRIMAVQPSPLSSHSFPPSTKTSSSSAISSSPPRQSHLSVNTGVSPRTNGVIPKATSRPGSPDNLKHRLQGGTGGGLLALRTDLAARSKPMPEIEPPTTSPGFINNSNPNEDTRGSYQGKKNGNLTQLSNKQIPLAPPRSPRPLNLLTAPNVIPTLLDTSPSPSPSTTTGNLPFPRSPVRARSNTAMLPRLAKLDTSDRLGPPPSSLSINTNLSGSTSPSGPSNPNMPPKLQLRTAPLKAATLAAPIASPKVSRPGLTLSLPYNRPQQPSSPSRGHFSYQSPTLETPMSGTSVFYTPVQTPSDFQVYYPQSAIYHQPKSPMLASPLTARPPPSPTTESASIHAFQISTILPGFLFLGPELTSQDQVEELKSLGVKRILNMAIECDENDYGLRLKSRFEKYTKVPMRDTVEEENIGRGVREACALLDDARLHSAPTYVHCKAGKSRSVTVVMAYLIHANHWPLARAYSFVLERRKGVSPNIGFVSELMTFEEQELGGKSVGVVGGSSSGEPDGVGAEDIYGGGAPAGGRQGNYGVAVGSRRAGHARESLPPVFAHSQSFAGMEGVDEEVAAGVGQDLEVKDAEGRYRHARRAPVDEQTLQPLRRVSKAGLESSWG
ncbi:hypothetical protein FRC03_011134 [Tulasnella sp. 419]|nr:hypothetical protein FRC03_011134 [Tulasnella sp. 419]